MLKKLFLFIFAFFLVITLHAQDTLRVMVYNLLYYGEYVFGCNASNNNPDNKDAYLRTILSHDPPDIFVVNEISRNSYFHQRIVDSVLHKFSERQYARAVSQNISSSIIMNMLYYNAEKLALHSQHIIQPVIRDIDVYTLYYKSPDLAIGDTVLLHCIAAHLKAGSSTDDQLKRRNEINNVIAWLQNNREQDNFLFMGDLNVNSVHEESMQLLLFGPDQRFRFYDPVDQLGTWWNNPSFANYHTQSTHTSSACHVGGGMDDRYDFILASADIMNGSKQISYIQDSYRTLGQDGQRFNKSLLDSPFNASAPFGVIEALYHNSDHLPVLLSLAIDQSPASSRMPFKPGAEFSYNNPVSDYLSIYSNLQHGTPYQIDIYSLAGGRHSSISDTLGNHPIKVNILHLPKGFYLVELIVQEYSKVFKIVKL